MIPSTSFPRIIESFTATILAESPAAGDRRRQSVKKEIAHFDQTDQAIPIRRLARAIHRMVIREIVPVYDAGCPPAKAIYQSQIRAPGTGMSIILV